MFLTFPSVFLFFYFLVTCCSGCSRLHVSSFGWSEWRVNLHFWCVFFFFSKAGIDECQREALPLWHGTPVTLTNRLLRHQVLFFCQRGKYCDYWCLIFVIMRKISSLKKMLGTAYDIHSQVATLAQCPFFKRFLWFPSVLRQCVQT